MSKPNNVRTKQRNCTNLAKKRNPPEQIAKSKQLVRKKATSPKKRNTKITKKKRELNGGCKLPTLSDLERMFEETESDISYPAPTSLNTADRNKSAERIEETTTTIDNDEIQFITEKAPLIDLSIPSIAASNIKSNFVIIDCDSDYLSDDLDDARPSKKKKIEEQTASAPCDIISKVTETQVETSNDSDATVAYDIDISTPGRFSPLPSTSRDNDTILKNEMRFNASFQCDESPKKMLDTSQKVIETSVEVLKTPETVTELFTLPEVTAKSPKQETVNKTPLETIVIDDEGDSSIIVFSGQNGQTKPPHPILIDDDCVICVDDHDDSKIPSPAIVIDEEYDIMPTNEETTINISDLSIDDIIAENSSIINKYSDKAIVTVTEVPPMQTESQINKNNTNLNRNGPDTCVSNPRGTTSNIQIELSDQNNSNDVIIEEHVLPSAQINQNNPNNHNNLVRSFLSTLQMIGSSLSQSAHINEITRSNENNSSASFNGNDLYPHNRRKRKRKTHNTLNVHSSNRIENVITSVRPELQSNSTIRSETHNDSLVRNEPGTSTQVPTSGRNIGDCPICLDPLSTKAVCSTICGHIFCMECIKMAVITSKRCPACRKVLKRNGFHPIFL